MLAYSELVTYILTFKGKVMKAVHLPHHVDVLPVNGGKQTKMKWRAMHIKSKVYNTYDKLGSWSSTPHWNSWCTGVRTFLKALQKLSEQMARSPPLPRIAYCK